METQRIKFTILELVYPPISNQEAEWLKSDPEVEERLRASDFYLIGARQEAFFENFVPSDGNRSIAFEYRVGDSKKDNGKIVLSDLPALEGVDFDTLEIELGPKMIRIWDISKGEDDESKTLVDWFTTEKILFDRARKRPGVLGLNDHANLAVYDLLYAGIAKTGDTFDRLFAGAHAARQKILSNEPQRYPGARITDELVLFAFSVIPTYITTFGDDHEFSEADWEEPAESKRVTADAEKAFVSLLKPEYNVVHFKNYPKGNDGLYDIALNSYSYAIAEEMTFRTAHGKFQGRRNADMNFIGDDADGIIVTKSGAAIVNCPKNM